MNSGESLTTNLVCNHDEARSLAHYKRENSNLARCYLALDIEVAELRRDAERYRWLRDHWWLDDKADATPAPMMNAQSPEQFDAAIDAALGDSRDA